MNSSCSCIRLAQKHIRTFTTSSIHSKSRSSHYDSLGITPKATQADVKTAYYELSKVYHPDRNKGSEEAAQKFRDISEAYEVLGNVKTRKLYDKGMSIGTTFGTQAYPKGRTGTFYEAVREQRTRTSASGGQQPIYDFDEWSKAHYGATFARDMARKQRNRVLREQEKEMQRSDKVERMLMGMALVLIVCMFVLSWGDDYDVTVINGTPIPKARNDDKHE